MWLHLIMILDLVMLGIPLCMNLHSVTIYRMVLFMLKWITTGSLGMAERQDLPIPLIQGILQLYIGLNSRVKSLNGCFNPY